ncbi:hypothetical protein Emag_002181 [Eimeria magna]
MRQQPSLSRSSSTDELLPKQQLPLPDGAACGALNLSPAAAAAAAAEAAAAAAAAAARAASEGLSEEDEQQLLQHAAEAYLMSVHLEAQALPLRVAAASGPTSSNKRAATASEAAASQTKESSCKTTTTTSSSSSSARYIQQLLRLHSVQQQQQRHPPHPAWEAEALDFFKRIRIWLQQQREQKQQEQQQQPMQLHLQCVTWTSDDWRLYCRRQPPTLPLLLQCDARCCCLLVQLLLEDLELQLQHEGSSKSSGTNTEAPLRAAAESSAAATAEAEAAATAGKAAAESAASAAAAAESAAAATAEAAAAAEASETVAGNAASEAPSAAATSCCSISGCPTSLPQLFWLFAVLAALDEVEALRFEVSYALQKLRRRCLRLRALVLRLLGCTGSCSAEEQEQQLKRLQKAVPFVPVMTSSGRSDVTTGQQSQQQEGLKQQHANELNQKERGARNLAEVALRQQLAALDVVLLIIRDFYGQK